MGDEQRYFGVVREFNSARGTGLIRLEDSSEDVFVRYSAILGEGVRKLVSGQRVSFELEKSTHGLSATRVLSE